MPKRSDYKAASSSAPARRRVFCPAPTGWWLPVLGFCNAQTGERETLFARAERFFLTPLQKLSLPADCGENSDSAIIRIAEGSGPSERLYVDAIRS